METAQVFYLTRVSWMFRALKVDQRLQPPLFVLWHGFLLFFRITRSDFEISDLCEIKSWNTCLVYLVFTRTMKGTFRCSGISLTPCGSGHVRGNKWINSQHIVSSRIINGEVSASIPFRVEQWRGSRKTAVYLTRFYARRVAETLRVAASQPHARFRCSWPIQHGAVGTLLLFRRSC